ncbi:unnamed protein product [Paramecium sonneborni]|uniref:AAA+ ATPase domain-containing protein n=1 Tax=Paramecium sonneborni TaxID=65129 RepID=A0A8S1LM40_9CILI|nr:unnamed protein product [Paramecium sonneborni]
MSEGFLNKLRDQAIQLIAQGKSEYLQGATLEAKQGGYDKMKLGCQELVKYARQETSQQLCQIASQKLNEFTTEMQNMKAYLDNYRANLQGQTQLPPQQQQQQQKLAQNPQGLQQLKGSTGQNDINKSTNQKDGQEQGKQKLLEGQQALRNNLSTAIVTEKPNVSWDDVAGLENAKNSLKEAIIMPMRFPELFQGARKPWMGILLYGPPGTGKTFLAKACATECEGTFFSVSSADLISKFVGESERLIKELFIMARESKPTIIFIDEVDSMTSNRESGSGNEASSRVKTQFLVEMQGVGNNNDSVLVLGATNLPWALDPAIRRRFEKRIYIPLPDLQGRLQLLKNKMKNTPNNLTLAEFEDIAKMLDGYSGSDMNTLIRDASFEPLRKTERATHFKYTQTPEGMKYMACSPSDPQGQQMRMYDIKGGQLYLPQIEYDDFLSVLPKCRPSVSQGDLKKYEDWTAEFGQDG